jgi:hypothetical protein
VNVSTTKNRVALHQAERRTIDRAHALTAQLAKAYEMTGQQSAVAKTASNALGDLCKQLDGNEVDERQLAESK